MTLPAAFLDTPITHRGLHDRAKGIIENSMPAFEAAIAAGYGIELDVQLTKDHQPMVFHDYDMKRLTGEAGPIQMRDADTVRAMTLTDSTDTIFGLDDVLTLVAGRVPLLIEIKDQDGDMGPNVGPLEKAVALALSGYEGDAAVMSFNPHSTALMGELCPDRPRGLVTSDFVSASWDPLSEATRARLRTIPDYDSSGASFISHDRSDLDSDRVAELKAQGTPVLCWTIKSQKQADEALKVADNITFEGFIPA